MIVKVHRNLNALPGVKIWSVSPISGPNHGRVVAHATGVRMSQCRFVISRPGQLRVREKGVRSVFAWIVGQLEGIDIHNLRYPDATIEAMPAVGETTPQQQIVFHSFNQDDFETVSGLVVTSAREVVAAPDGRCMATISISQ